MPNATFIGSALTDRIQAKVDVGSGDLLLTTTDLTLPAIGADLNQLTSIVTDRGATANRTGAVGYGSNGMISTITQTGTDGTSRKVSYGYDSANNLTALTDPSGKITTFGYDGSHGLTTITTVALIG